VLALDARGDDLVIGRLDSRKLQNAADQPNASQSVRTILASLAGWLRQRIRNCALCRQSPAAIL
jgi:hypothetical protein